MDQPLTRTYKRSQVEQVIGMLEFRLHDGRTDPALRSRLKRLLDADRRPASETEGHASRPMAFADIARPGQGTEIGYTAFHAFALVIGVRLLQGGITEGRTVALLQRVRPALEGAFARIAAVPRRTLQEGIWQAIDPEAPIPKDLTALEAEQRVRDGVIVGNPRKMTFLVEVAGGGDGDGYALATPDADENTLNICGHAELLLRLRSFSHVGRPAVVIELTNAVHQLLYFLPNTTVRKRGRP